MNYSREKGPQRPSGRPEAMRERAMESARKRKEEFLGARVPKALRDKVIARAEAQGIPVSILIRQILEQAFQAEAAPAGVVQAASSPPASPVLSETDQGHQRFSDVLGWEQIRLNRSASCSACGLALQPGNTATVGLSATGGAPVVLCTNCKGHF